MTTPSHTNARRHERVEAVMPIRLSGQTGYTRDISIGGCYLLLEGAAMTECEVCFDLDMGMTHGAMTMRCCGQVMRRELQGCLTGIAVQIKGLQLLMK